MLSTFTDIISYLKINVCEFSHKTFLHETIESRNYMKTSVKLVILAPEVIACPRNFSEGEEDKIIF
jgi:hypothetical protein